MEKIKLYAAYNLDSGILEKSSSGGLFTPMAKWIIENDGYVCAAAYDYDTQELRHILFNEIEEIEKCRGSKYFQSKIDRNIYSAIERLLKDEKKVFFIGTPCQVKAIKMYCAVKKINEENLFLCDIICHGVGSPGIWKSYSEYLQHNKKGEIQYLTFKGKEKGWKRPSVYALINNKKCSIRNYSWLYFDNSIMRPSCYKCRYSSINREGDVSIGDFWKVNKYHPEMFNEKGTSFIMINNEKGELIFKNINESLNYKETNLEKCIQNNMKKPTSKNADNGIVMKDYAKKKKSVFFKKWYVKLLLKKIGK